MATLKQHLEEKLLTAIKPGSKVYFIDYPVYGNIGDILIAKGTEAFFRTNGIKVIGRASMLNYCFPPTAPDCTLVLQGGGNFGDLYQTHQVLREQVVARFPDRRVVVLPQTIHFQSSCHLEASAGIFRKHPDLHLFVRDERSCAYGERFTDNVVLCPDMSTELWPISSGETPKYPILYLLRSDSEAAACQPVFSGNNVKDWNTVLGRIDRHLMRYLRKLHKLDRVTGNSVLNPYHCWRIYTDWLVRRVVKEFSRYEEIVTSRLHGHILACLMGKANYMLDNSYGKNYSYYQAWSRFVPYAHWGLKI
jgi:pyruvyl transferase EpsO